MARLPILLAAVFCALFLVLPLGVMAWSTFAGPEGFTLDGYRGLFAELASAAGTAKPIAGSQLLYSVELGLAAMAIAFVLGCGYAFLTIQTDLPGASLLAPLGVAPLVIPPILVAMGFADLTDVAGFGACAVLLGIAYAPFVTVLAGRALRGIDGRLYEAAWIGRGRARAERMLFRLSLPEILAGCLLVFVFVLSEHGVPEFLTVKGKTWHTYAEGVFAKWNRRATGVSHEDLVSPIVAALPLLLIIVVALVIALRLRAHTSIHGDHQPLPVRRLGRWRFVALLWPALYLGLGLVLPVVVMGRWAAGSTQVDEPMSLAKVRASAQLAIDQAGHDLTYTLLVGGIACAVCLAVAMPLALAAARERRWIDYLAVVPIAVPAILLGIGTVKVWNSPVVADAVYPWTGDLYDTPGLLACAYAARLLPFGVLTLSHAARRQPASVEEAARMCGRGPAARFWRIQMPLLRPAAWSAACLVFVLAVRELDLAVVLPAGNDTVVRRLSNVVHFGGEDMGGALALLLLFAAVALPLVTVLLTGRKMESLS